MEDYFSGIRGGVLCRVFSIFRKLLFARNLCNCIPNLNGLAARRVESTNWEPSDWYNSNFRNHLYTATAIFSRAAVAISSILFGKSVSARETDILSLNVIVCWHTFKYISKSYSYLQPIIILYFIFTTTINSCKHRRLWTIRSATRAVSIIWNIFPSNFLIRYSRNPEIYWALRFWINFVARFILINIMLFVPIFTNSSESMLFSLYTTVQGAIQSFLSIARVRKL